jgi:hypothetical protein
MTTSKIVELINDIDEAITQNGRLHLRKILRLGRQLFLERNYRSFDICKDLIILPFSISIVLFYIAIRPIVIFASILATISLKIFLIEGDKRTTSREMPPSLAEKFLYVFLTAEQRKHVPGDLSEEFHDIILPKFGAKYARRWFWFQTVRSIADNVGVWPMRFVLFLAGAFGLKELVEMWRRSK